MIGILCAMEKEIQLLLEKVEQKEEHKKCGYTYIPGVLNGKRVILRGACIHHDNGVIGAVAIHLQSAADRARVMGYRDITVDIGANDAHD